MFAAVWLALPRERGGLQSQGRNKPILRFQVLHNKIVSFATRNIVYWVGKPEGLPNGGGKSEQMSERWVARIRHFLPTQPEENRKPSLGAWVRDSKAQLRHLDLQGSEVAHRCPLTLPNGDLDHVVVAFILERMRIQN